MSDAATLQDAELSQDAIRNQRFGILAFVIAFLASLLAVLYVCWPLANNASNALMQSLTHRTIRGTPLVLPYLVLLLSFYLAAAATAGNASNRVNKVVTLYVAVSVGFLAAYMLAVHQNVFAFWITAIVLSLSAPFLVPRAERNAWTYFVAAVALFWLVYLLGHPLGYAERVVPSRYSTPFFLFRIALLLCAGTWLCFRIATTALAELHITMSEPAASQRFSRNPVAQVVVSIGDVLRYLLVAPVAFFKLFAWAFTKEVRAFAKRSVWEGFYKFCFFIPTMLLCARLLPIARDHFVAHLRADDVVDGMWSRIIPLLKISAWVPAAIILAAISRFLLCPAPEGRHDVVQRLGNPPLYLIVVVVLVGWLCKALGALRLPLIGFSGWPLTSTLIVIFILIALVMHRVSLRRFRRKAKRTVSQSN